MLLLHTHMPTGRHLHRAMKSLMGKCCYTDHPYAVIVSVLCSYYLERSNSAKITFKRAVEIFPIEVSVCLPYILMN